MPNKSAKQWPQSKHTACWQRSLDVHQNRPVWSYYRRFCSHLSLI